LTQFATPSEDDGLDFSVWWCGILPGSPPWERNIFHERDAPIGPSRHFVAARKLGRFLDLSGPLSAAMLSLILTVTAANKAPGQPYRSHVAQLRKHEPNKHRGNSRVARATAKDKSTSVVADAGRLPKVAGK
jgi:hypothetical protein